MEISRYRLKKKTKVTEKRKLNVYTYYNIHRVWFVYSNRYDRIISS